MKKIMISTMLLLANSLYASSIPVTLENKNIRPVGAGYNSRSSTLFQACVDNSLESETTGPVVTTQNASGSFNLRLEASQESLSKKLGVDVGGKYRSGVTEYSASAEFLKESKSNGFSIAYNYASEHLYQETMNASRSRPISPLPGFSEIVLSRDIFFERCGDEFVWMRDRAARLLININVSFVTKSERTRFAAKFGISSPVTKFDASFENDMKEFSSNNQMSVRVIQIGGDPSRIGQVLCPKKSDGQVDEECSKNAGAIVNCSFGNIAVCSGLIANAIAYANAQDGDNFPSQIRGGKNYDVVALHTAPYVQLGSPYLTPPTAQNQIELQVALKQLSDIFETQYRLWAYADKLYTGRAPRLTSRQKNEMEVLRSMLDKNMRRASLGINYCYDLGYQKCQTEVDQVKAFIGLDRQGDIDDQNERKIEALTKAESFVQYCDMSDDEHPELKVTMNTLKAYAVAVLGNHSDTVTKGDSCFNLAEWYKAQKVIDLSGYPSLKLGDLRPFSLLTNLEKLDLSGKNVRDISDLGSLVNLEELKLDNNYIENLDALKNMRKLRELSIKNNKIAQDAFNALSSLSTPYGSLVYIDARGNADKMTCPLSSPNQCKLLNFNNAVNVVPTFNKCSMMIGHGSAPLDETATLSTGGYSLDGKTYYTNTMQLVTNSGCQPLPNKMIYPRAMHTMTKLPDGRIVAIGGHTNTIEVIDPVTFTSTLVKDVMSDYRSMHTATLLPDGRILIIGGFFDKIDMRTRTTKVSSSVDIFNPATMKLERFGKMHIPRTEHTATLLKDGRVLVLGGYSEGSMINIAEIINVKYKTIETLEEPLNVGRNSHSAILLPNGNVAILGGYVWATEIKEGETTEYMKGTSKIEIFDAENETFELTSEELIPARGSMQTWTLPDGKIMLIGGEKEGAFFDGIQISVKSVAREIQVFDPDSYGIYDVAKLNVGRLLFTATQLKNRSVVIFGGAGEESAFNSSEVILYRPK